MTKLSKGWGIMSKKEKKETIENNINTVDVEEIIEGDDSNLSENPDGAEEALDDLDTLKAKLEEQCKKSEEYLNILQRTKAEFDNYKKRTLREKGNIYSDGVCDSVSGILDVLDNLERAYESCNISTDTDNLSKGVEMVLKQFKESITKIGVEEIKAVGEKFDPELHNAVMHIENEDAGESEILEEFQKGYKIGEKVIRHSMVKVAN